MSASDQNVPITEQQYQDIALVDLYDQLNPLGRDSDYFISACAPTTYFVLDLGCGTGLLSATLADQGHTVLGVDPSEAMLRIARDRTPSPNISWLQADARHLNVDRQFDRVIATGHVFQVFLTEADQLAFLQTARRHLTATGRLVFDTRNPLTLPWLAWTPDQSRREIDHDRHGRIEIWHETTEVHAGTVAFKSSYRFLDQDRELTSNSKLAFPTADVLHNLLSAAGLETVTLHGDWNSSVYHRSSPEIIVNARPSHANT